MSDFERFSRIFKDNINKRSRTAKGVSDVSSTPGKKKLLLEGSELSDQVKKNTDELVRRIWHDIREHGRFKPATPTALRERFEGWYNVINHKLQQSSAAERAEFIAKAQQLKGATGRNYRINPRYRLAVPKYLIEKGCPVYPIVELEFQMDQFYVELSDALINRAVNSTMSTPQLLAFADMQIDGVIHPWADGCGRLATAAVMWLGLWCGGELPVFGDRDEHYKAIKAVDLVAHINYFERCFS